MAPLPTAAPMVRPSQPCLRRRTRSDPHTHTSPCYQRPCHWNGWPPWGERQRRRFQQGDRTGRFHLRSDTSAEFVGGGAGPGAVPVTRAGHVVIEILAPAPVYVVRPIFTPADSSHTERCSTCFRNGPGPAVCADLSREARRPTSRSQLLCPLSTICKRVHILLQNLPLFPRRRRAPKGQFGPPLSPCSQPAIELAARARNNTQCGP